MRPFRELFFIWCRGGVCMIFFVLMVVLMYGWWWVGASRAWREGTTTHHLGEGSSPLHSLFAQERAHIVYAETDVCFFW